MIKKFTLTLLFLVLLDHKAHATKSCSVAFNSLAPNLSDFSEVTSWALQHSSFKNLTQVKKRAKYLAEKGYITKNMARRFAKFLKMEKKIDHAMAIRIKFIFNSIETVNNYVQNKKNKPEDYAETLKMKMLAHVAIWIITTHHLEPLSPLKASLSKLVLRNHFANSVENMLEDFVTQAYVSELFFGYYKVVMENQRYPNIEEFSGYPWLEKIKTITKMLSTVP